MSHYFSELKGKTIVVTGGSKGIGKEIALTFARLQANVVIIGRGIEALIETVSKLQQLHTNCSYIQADLKEVKQIENAMDQIAVQYGTIDVLINNAGINIAKPALAVTEQDWDDVLDINLKSTFFCSQAAAKYMLSKESGKIINIVSQMAFVGYYNRAAYCSSKGGVVQLTKALAVEWSKKGIRVNAVAPTFIETELTSKMFEDEGFKKDVYERILVGELAKPSDITGAVLYLASNLSQFVTGETIKVDGGWTAI